MLFDFFFNVPFYTKNLHQGVETPHEAQLRQWQSRVWTSRDTTRLSIYTTLSHILLSLSGHVA